MATLATWEKALRGGGGALRTAAAGEQPKIPFVRPAATQQRSHFIYAKITNKHNTQAVRNNNSKATSVCMGVCVCESSAATWPYRTLSPCGLFTVVASGQ